MNEGRRALQEKSFAFAIRIVNLYKYVGERKREYVLSKQLLRSGTSVGAAIREAQNAESRGDFIHKWSVAQKECDESIYWIELISATGYLKETEIRSLNHDAQEILKIIKSAILTTRQNFKR
jgi:four helix bundle protein